MGPVVSCRESWLAWRWLAGLEVAGSDGSVADLGFLTHGCGNTWLEGCLFRCAKFSPAGLTKKNIS